MTREYRLNATVNEDGYVIYSLPTELIHDLYEQTLIVKQPTNRQRLEVLCHDMFLEYFTKYMTEERMAGHYGIPVETIGEILAVGKIINSIDPERARINRIKKDFNL